MMRLELQHVIAVLSTAMGHYHVEQQAMMYDVTADISQQPDD